MNHLQPVMTRAAFFKGFAEFNFWRASERCLTGPLRTKLRHLGGFNCLCSYPANPFKPVLLHQYGSFDMVTHMKTTVEISDALLEAARKVAIREGTTLRELIETGLRQALAERQQPGAFKLRKASFRGKGLQPPLKGASWEQLREMAYEGRGT
jgi:hypothetical protein